MSGEVTITVAGDVGIGKSALICMIEDYLQSIGVPTRHADPASAVFERDSIVDKIGTVVIAEKQVMQFKPTVVFEEKIVRPS